MFSYKNITFLLSGIVIGGAAIWFSSSSKVVRKEVIKQINEKDSLSYLEQIKENHQVFSVPIPNTMEFCGESIPLDNSFVLESLDKELLVNTHWHSHTFLLLKKSKRWFPIIEPILKDNGIPDDFKYLALIESGLENVVSPAGAAGFWQFLKNTAKEYDLEVSNEVDERYHLEKATVAACNYLKKAYQDFENWSLVAASYNMGRAGLKRQLERQKVNSYYDLLLNSETARYVYRILAVKLIFNEPEQYGFRLREDDFYPPLLYRTIEIDSNINSLIDFAKENNTNYKTLKIYNPWLRQESLSVKKGKNYFLKIPS